MGFKEAKSKVIQCLNTGHVLHEERGNIDTKNLLSIGVITTEELVKIISRSSGNQYSSSPHHFDSHIEVHVIKTSYFREIWYIKWYFLEPDSVFISVHH